LLRIVRCGYSFAFQEKILKIFYFLKCSDFRSCFQDKSQMMNFKGKTKIFRQEKGIYDKFGENFYFKIGKK
jgi:hypothetical protein